MARISVISLLLVIIWQTIDLSTQEREVLIRDRLVLVLCDQVHEYLNTGKFPEPVKKMPDKYKSVKPGKSGRMEGFQVIPPGGKKKREAAYYENHPILDFLYT